MRELSKDELESLFPAQCHFKVIAYNIDGIHSKLNDALFQLGIEGKAFQPSARSRHGKYVSFAIGLRVQTHDQMLDIDRTLRRIKGVRMVL